MKNSQLGTCFLMALLVVNAKTAFSDDWVITEDDLFAEIDYVSGVTHLKQDLKQVPAAVTIIDRRAIESSTAVDLVDLFRLVPGFQVYFFHGNKPGVTYHVHGGEYSRRLEVKIDGRSVYEPLLSSVEWNTLGVELDDVEYIEVVRGSNSAGDGSNAFIASINIVTRSPLADLGTKVSFKTGSHGINTRAISHSSQFGQLATRATLKASKNDGFEEVDDSADTFSLRYQGLWTPTVNDTINFQIGLGITQTTIEHDDDEESLTPGRDWSSKYQYFNWKRVTNNWSDIEFSLYHNAIDFVDDDADWSVQVVLDKAQPFHLQNTRELLDAETNKDEVKIIEPTYEHNSNRWDADLRANIYHIHDLRVNLGIASRYDGFDTELFLGGPGKVSQVSNRLYANMEWTALDQLTLNYGHTVEKRRNNDATDAFRVSANFELSTNHMFRIASSKSYRQPTLLEANQNSIYTYNGETIHIKVESDRDILEEKLTSHEVGYLGSFFNKTLNLDIRLFDEDMFNLIDERVSLYNDIQSLSEESNTGLSNSIGTNQITLENFGETQIDKNVIDNVEDLRLKGLEWQLQYKPSNKFLLNVNHTYIDSSGLGWYGIKVDEDTLTWKENVIALDKAVPEKMLNVLASYKLNNGVRLSGSYHYKSDYKSEIRKGTSVQSYSRIDLKASKKWRLANNWIELSLTAQNTGSDYFEFFSYNKFESKYIVGLRMGSY